MQILLRTTIVFNLLLVVFFCNQQVEEVAANEATITGQGKGKKGKKIESASTGATIVAKGPSRAQKPGAPFHFKEDHKTIPVEAPARKTCYKGFHGLGKSLMFLPYAVATIMVIAFGMLFMVLCVVVALIIWLFALFTFLFSPDHSSDAFGLGYTIITHSFGFIDVLSTISNWYFGNCGA